MRKLIRFVAAVAVVGAALTLGGCAADVGVGLNVGVPIGDHGHINIGTGGWY